VRRRIFLASGTGGGNEIDVGRGGRRCGGGEKGNGRQQGGVGKRSPKGRSFADNQGGDKNLTTRGARVHGR